MGRSKMTILYRNFHNEFFRKTYYEIKNEPFYLNGDALKNAIHRTCNIKIFKINASSIGLA